LPVDVGDLSSSLQEKVRNTTNININIIRALDRITFDFAFERKPELRCFILIIPSLCKESPNLLLFLLIFDHIVKRAQKIHRR
jgi:hypothetical protein